MGKDHSLQAEFERVGLVSVIALAGIQPGEMREMDLTEQSIYVHLPTVDANGNPETVGVNLTKVTVQRP